MALSANYAPRTFRTLVLPPRSLQGKLGDVSKILSAAGGGPTAHEGKIALSPIREQRSFQYVCNRLLLRNGILQNPC